MEADNNRRWLLANRLGPGKYPTDAPSVEEPGALLYYLSQLEEELSRVREKLARLGEPSH